MEAGMHVKSHPQFDGAAAEEGPMDAAGWTRIRNVWELEQDAVRSPYSSLLMLLALPPPYSCPSPSAFDSRLYFQPSTLHAPGTKSRPLLAVSALNLASVNQCTGLFLPLLGL